MVGTHSQRFETDCLRFLGEGAAQAPAGEIDGAPVTWVMSLMEEHTSLYGADAVEGRILIVQAADGATLAKLVVDRAQCGVWREALKESLLAERFPRSAAGAAKALSKGAD